MDLGLFFTKLLPKLVYPVGLTGVLLFIAALLLLLRWRLSALVSIVCACIVLLASASPNVADHLLGSLEAQFPPLTVYDTPKADAIVYLGGGLGVMRPPRLSVDLLASSDRLLHTARLYRAGRAPVVIVSGGSVWPRQQGLPESQDAASLLVEWGVDESAIIIEDRSRTTYENAVNTRGILRDHHLRQVLLVTSASHMRRSLATFRSLGIEAIAATTDHQVTRSDEPPALRWLPSADALGNSERAIKELIGYFVYHWRGWITDAGDASVDQEVRANIALVGERY
jgi:uncharacterized SAM-binding protein YcdF (DUF218 family)